MKMVNTIKQIDDLLGNFQQDEVVYLDKGQVNERIVTIKAFGKRFVKIEDEQGQQYEVMIFRLSKY